MTRGRGHCATCDRIFTLTFKGTIPAHTVGASKPAGPVATCAGSHQAPKLGTVTAR